MNSLSKQRTLAMMTGFERDTKKTRHVFPVMKLTFGFVNVRDRGLKKNAHRLLVNLRAGPPMWSRKPLLRAAA